MSCYLCGTKEYKKRDGSVRDNSNLEILECISCGLVYLSSKDHIDETFYQDSKMSKELSVQTWLRQTHGDDKRRLELVREMITDKNVLDFGSGIGGFLSLAKEHASYVCGIELDKRVTAHYVDIGVKLVDDIGLLQDDFFDVITAFHVVEHLDDPVVILQQLLTKLKRGGRMIVEVPNSNDALLTLYRSKHFMNFTYWSPHLFLFNGETIKRLFEKINDCKLEFVKYIQRYPLSNHLYWLSQGQPGGHQVWGGLLDSPQLHKEYETSLASLGLTDTVLAQIVKV